MLKRDLCDLSEIKIVFLRSLTCDIKSSNIRQRILKMIHTLKIHVDRLIVLLLLLFKSKIEYLF